MKRWISLILVLTICFCSLPVLAESKVALTDDDSTAVYIGAAVAGGIVAFLIVRAISVNSKAATYYKQAEQYALQGRWDLAVEAYVQCLKVKANYRDAVTKLENAKTQAEKMFVHLGDEAKAQEKYEEALTYYQKALSYRPESMATKAKIDELAADLAAVHYRRGFSFEVQNKWQEAFNEYEKAYFANPNYQDIAARYARAKAKLKGDLSLRAILFFVNRSSQFGIDKPLIQALQKELEVVVSNKFTMLDYQVVQNVLTEQAAGLSDTLNEGLAMDLGRILGVNEVILGEISSVEVKQDRVKMAVTMKILKVPSAELIEKVEVEHTFSKEVILANLPQAMPELAKEIVKKMKH